MKRSQKGSSASDPRAFIKILRFIELAVRSRRGTNSSVTFIKKYEIKMHPTFLFSGNVTVISDVWRDEISVVTFPGHCGEQI